MCKPPGPPCCDVLVVDDDDDNREVMVLVLESEGLTARGVSSSEEALALLRAGGSPRSVLVDLVMPGMGGLALIEAMRTGEDTSKVPILIVTAAVEIPAPPGIARLTKPFERDDLLRALWPLVRGVSYVA
jgi:CheY-like chemotaxis protein